MAGCNVGYFIMIRVIHFWISPALNIVWCWWQGWHGDTVSMYEAHAGQNSGVRGKATWDLTSSLGLTQERSILYLIYIFHQFRGYDVWLFCSLWIPDSRGGDTWHPTPQIQSSRPPALAQTRHARGEDDWQHGREGSWKEHCVLLPEYKHSAGYPFPKLSWDL